MIKMDVIEEIKLNFENTSEISYSGPYTIHFIRSSTKWTEGIRWYETERIKNYTKRAINILQQNYPSNIVIILDDPDNLEIYYSIVQEHNKSVVDKLKKEIPRTKEILENWITLELVDIILEYYSFNSRECIIITTSGNGLSIIGSLQELVCQSGERLYFTEQDFINSNFTISKDNYLLSVNYCRSLDDTVVKIEFPYAV